MKHLIFVPFKQKGYRGAEYEFYFVPADLIPDGGQIKLEFGDVNAFDLNITPNLYFEAPEFRNNFDKKAMRPTDFSVLSANTILI